MIVLQLIIPKLILKQMKNS
ncbi:unnamed protein product, partial [Rotaria sordida]